MCSTCTSLPIREESGKAFMSRGEERRSIDDCFAAMGVTEGRRYKEILNFIDVLGLVKSVGPSSAIPNDRVAKKPSGGTDILDVEVGGEGGLEVDEEGTVS